MQFSGKVVIVTGGNGSIGGRPPALFAAEARAYSLPIWPTKGSW